MPTVTKSQRKIKPQGRSKRFMLPIGLRLLIAFQIIILLTGIIGFLAVQRFSQLTSATTELNTHDLPEVITLGRLRTLLYQQYNLELNLVTNGLPDSERGNNIILKTQCSTIAPVISADGEVESEGYQTCVSVPVTVPTTNITSNDNKALQQQSLQQLGTTLQNIVAQRTSLLVVDAISSKGPTATDSVLIQSLNNGITSSNQLSAQVQTLIKHNQYTQAYTLEQKQQEPLLQKNLNTAATLRDLEQVEASTTAAQVQQESGAATTLILVLTAFALLLSFLLAIFMTRSLTKPLSVLLHATGTIASGDLEATPRINRSDEIGRLALAFDQMRLSLRSNIATLAAERQQTQAIIDASADGVLLVDEERRITRCNPAAERLSEWESQDAIGHHCWEVFGCHGRTAEEAEEHERHCPLLMALQQPEKEAYAEMQSYSYSGKQRWLAVSCAPISQDKATSGKKLVVGLHDISQLKAVEQMKTDFVAMVSHELRAPLTTVTGSVETLSLLQPEEDKEVYHEVLGILDQQTRRLRHVVEEVLQLTRFEANRLQIHLQPLPIIQFLQDTLAHLRVESTGDGRTISLHAPTADIQVWADAAMLEIVIRNVLDNARKYTPVDSTVEMVVEPLPAQGLVQIRILDHGPGIPLDQIDHIFERFSRGTHTSSDWTRGYGLGLYIARELLQAHNGTIRAENHASGASFVLSLREVLTDQPETEEKSAISMEKRETESTV
ncbi:MAG TPA: ATP-binding protein [Ktedonobacteraceae bacterium]|nr:ATP-binding protein [Ktedonobacteraceae bacterium]